MVFSVIFACLLSSCASVQQEKARVNFKSPQSLQRWTAKGSISITTPDDSTQAKYVWVQEKNNYTIDFFGPLGSYHHHLDGQAGHVSLIDYQGKKQEASSAHALLQQTVGWNLPVESLKDWIRGIKTPAENWKITYLSMTQVGAYQLPSTLILDHPGIKIKIKITEWTLPKNPASH